MALVYQVLLVLDEIAAPRRPKARAASRMTAFFLSWYCSSRLSTALFHLGFGAARRGVFEAARPAAVVLMLGSLFEFGNRGGRARPPQARKF